MAEAEDDIVVIIVKDEEASQKSPIKVKDEIVVKEEPVDMSVEELIKVAEEHGERVELLHVKEEPLDEDYQHEYIDDGSDGSDGGDVDDEYSQNDDDEYVPGQDIEDSDDEVKNRRNMKKPWQRKSYVSDLIRQNPKFKKDQKALLDTLVEVMRSVKAPPLPKNYCVPNEINFECSKCGSVSDSLAAAGRHYQEKHGQRYLICFACGVDFRSTTNLYKHEKRCIAPDAVIVLKARAMFLGRKGRSRPFLQYDRESVPKKGKYVQKFFCDQCPAMFLSKVALMSHQYHHQGVRPFQCKECPCAYTSPSALLRHEKKHSDMQYICDNCGRSFKLKATLSAHMDTHRPLKKHACSECDRRYAQRSALLLHINREHRHLPPPCACRICPRRYPRMSLLKIHMKKAHGMLLMTRKMFFKSVPTMPDIELEKAKLVLKSEVTGSGNDYILAKDNEDTENYNDEFLEQNEENVQEENDNEDNTQLTEDVIEILKTMQSGGSDGVKIVVVEDGQFQDASEVQLTEMTAGNDSEGDTEHKPKRGRKKLKRVRLG